MASSARFARIPLLKGWSREVQSAVVHVVSIARVSLTIARADVENQFDAHIRLRTENERLLGRSVTRVPVRGRRDSPSSRCVGISYGEVGSGGPLCTIRDEFGTPRGVFMVEGKGMRRCA